MMENMRLFSERLEKIEKKALDLGVIGIDNFPQEISEEKELNELEFCLNYIEKDRN